MPTRGLRNNNPGNIDFAHQAGAVPEPITAGVPKPRFAKFPTMRDGISALAFQLWLYFSRGINTTQAIIGKWAPPTENYTHAYTLYVAKNMGVSPTQKLECTPEVLTHLVMAISHFENGANLPFTEATVLPIVQGRVATLV